MASSSSLSAAQEQHHQPNPYSAAATSAPPPTPSAQPHNTTNSHAPDNISTSAAVAADTLSRLLNRLPAPSLSLPSRRRPSPLSSSSSTGTSSSISPPVISLSNDADIQSSLLSAASEHGFFQLTTHKILSQLANSAESEALALFHLPDDQKEMHFPRKWPLGYEADEDGNNGGASFWLDSADNDTSSMTSSLLELTRAIEGVGLQVIRMLARAVGFENPKNRVCSMMVVSDGEERGSGSGGGFYPYVVGLQYQIRRQKHCLLGDSGSGSWVTVLPEVESVLVTVGDIGQVWSNGKLKKVRGMGLGSLEQGSIDNNKSTLSSSSSRRRISMRVLITLPLEDTISPLVSSKLAAESEEEEEVKFRSFGMEDYAWRVYHEPFIFKDPLHRYRSSL